MYTFFYITIIKINEISYYYYFYFFTCFNSCNKDEAIGGNPEKDSNNIYDIKLIDSKLLSIAEPSGLSWALNQIDFIVVDDRTNKAFIINKEGIVLSEYPYTGDDTEGVTINMESNEIWIAEEAESELIRLNMNGVKQMSYKIDINRNSSKKGLEGLTYDSANKVFYILNEAEPGLLIKWQINKGIKSEYGWCCFEVYYQGLLRYEIGHFKTNDWHVHSYDFSFSSCEDQSLDATLKIEGPDAKNDFFYKKVIQEEGGGVVFEYINSEKEVYNVEKVD